MAFGDIYELVDQYEFRGQKCMNVYFYRQNNLAVSVTAQDLVDSFLGQVMPSIRALQSGEILHTELRCRNLFDAADKVLNAVSLAGLGGVVDDFPTFAAIGFTLVQDNGAVRNGAKRIGVPPEIAVTEGVITDAAYIVAIQALANLFSESLEFGVITTFLPVIVKRISEGLFQYRLPENQGEAVYGTITDASYDPLVTSQVSRKIGRGA